jgi:hypothetical protein
MLVVSCGTISNPPSTSTNSTITSINSSSEVSESNRKVSFNEIGSLVAQVVDAKAMGIVNSKDRVQQNSRLNQEGVDQNYMVKVTETYNPNTQITEDQTIQVTFTRVTNTQTTELQTGTATHVATADPITIERATNLPGNIVITNVIGYEFRLLSGETIVEDWMSSDLETIEFIFDEALTDIVIESRSLNASISFTTFEDFTYTINQGDQVLYEDILDNDLVDNNAAVGAITISGLTEGLAYGVTYAGNQVIETITQDEVDGQVDKLFVLYQYTFISFVPLNLNPRPQDQDLELDYDDIPSYDKTGFYSDSTRQSFVVDNNTGLIYKIEGMNIASLSGGCVSIQNSPFPFDMRITEQNELEFYSLHQNASINTYSCLKDMFNNIFIRNDLLNYFDGTNNVTYYVLNDTFRKGYFFNQKKEVFMRDLSLNEIKLFVASGQSRDLNNFDSFYVFEENHENGLYLVENGVLKHFYQNQNFGGHSFFGKNYLKYGTDNGYSYELDLISEKSQSMFLTKFGKDYGIILELKNGNLYLYINIWESFDDYFSQFKSESFVEEDIWLRNLTENSFFTKNEILNGVTLNNSNEIVKVTPSGSLNYEIIPEFIDNEWTITPYIYGTYFAPSSITITLQPTNR